MPRSRDSLFAPIAFAMCCAVFASGAAYTWWLDNRSPEPVPLRAVTHAMLPPVRMAPTDLPPRPEALPVARRHTSRVLNRCLDAAGVPNYTSDACPAGTRLDKQITVRPEVEPRRAVPPPPTNSAASVANATVVNNVRSAGYDIPSRQERRDYELEHAFDRCERAKVRERAELQALGLRRKMSDIREWADYTVHECATYKVLTRRG